MLTGLIKKRLLFLRASGIFLCAFLGAGLINVFPQILFQRFYPAQKKFYLSIFLLTGTAAAILGLWASHRQQRVTAQTNVTWVPMVASLVILSVLMSMVGLRLSTSLLWLFSLHVFARFGMGYLLNLLDIETVHKTPLPQQPLNNQVVLVYRLLGMLIAPPFFALLFDRWIAMNVVLCMVTVVALVGSWTLLKAPYESKQVTKEEATPQKIRTYDIMVTVFGLLSYTCFYLVATNLIYYLKDCIGIAGAETKGAFMVMLVFMTSIVSLSLAPRLLRTHGKQRSSVKADSTVPSSLSVYSFFVPVLIFGVALVFWRQWAQSEVSITFCSMLLGAIFGFFLYELRAYMAKEARAKNNVALMSIYNNIPFVSSLFAFILMLVLSRMSFYKYVSYFTGLFGLLMVFSVLSVGVLFVMPRVTVQQDRQAV